MVERVSMAIAEKIPNFSMIGIGFYDKQTAGIKFVKEKDDLRTQIFHGDDKRLFPGNTT